MQYTKQKLHEILKNHDGLKFHLINKSNKTDILFRTLANRGIKNLKHYADPKPNVDFKPSAMLKNPLSSDLVRWFNSYVLSDKHESYDKKAKNVFILVDNDADGFTSAAFMYQYLSNFDIKCKFIFTYGKNHGIKASPVKAKLKVLKNVGLIIIPDASLSLDDIQFLKDQNYPYIIMDHHDLNHQKIDLGDKLHIFNNQWQRSKINPQFTGVGVVYLFCHELDKLHHTDYANHYLYLMSIGQIGDVSDISNPEIRYYVKKGFEQMHVNPILRLTTDTRRLSAHELSFSFIPKVNAVCRTGSLEDKNELMRALIKDEPKDLVKVSYWRKSKIDHKFHKHYRNVNHYYLEAKKLNRIKSHQKRAVKKSLKALKHIYETKSFIIALDKTGLFKQEEAGLIATQLSNKYQKPTLVLRTCNKPDYYKGSARGNDKVMSNFRKFCLQTHKFNYALGHPQAFGVMISDSKLKELLDEYKDVNLNDKNIVYDVDNLYLDDVPSKQDIISFDDNRDLFGGKINNPQLGFVGLKVNTRNIKMFGSLLTFKAHNLNFIMFNCSENMKNIIKGWLYGPSSDFYFDIVGSPDINRFMKYHYPQIIIQNIKFSSPIQTQFKVNNNFKNFVF